MFFLGLVIGFVLVFPCIVFYFLFIRGADRYEPEPLWLLLATLAWGATGATLTAVVGSAIGAGALGMAMNTGADDPLLQASVASFVAPVVEETTKGVALLALWLASVLGLKELDGPLDGAIYGGMIGLGFTLTEDVLYLASAMDQGGLEALGFTFVARTVLAGLGHASFTAVLGLGIGFGAISINPVLRVLWPFLGFGAAIALHSLHNLLVTFLLGEGIGFVIKLVLFWFFNLLFFVVVLVLAARDRRIVAGGLADEVETLLSSTELARTTSWGMLIPLWNWITLSGSPSGYWASRRKQLDLVELAFIKHRLERGEDGLGGREAALRSAINQANQNGITIV